MLRVLCDGGVSRPLPSAKRYGRRSGDRRAQKGLRLGPQVRHAVRGRELNPYSEMREGRSCYVQALLVRVRGCGLVFSPGHTATAPVWSSVERRCPRTRLRLPLTTRLYPLTGTIF